MKTLTINQMSSIAGGASTEHNACVGLMWVCGGIWSGAISMAGTPVAGAAFGLGWSYFSDWVCSHA